MRERKVITHTKQKRNLFVLELTATGIAMAIRSFKSRKIMAITNCGRPAHLVS